jgi:hypothetical protein
MYVDRDHISRYVEIAKIVATGKLAKIIAKTKNSIQVLWI